jgi:hypothetical protein
LLVTSELVHIVAIASTFLGGFSPKALAWLRASFYSFLGWIFAVIAIRNLRRPAAGGFLAATFAGICVFVFTGLADFATLYRSLAPFACGIRLDRVTIMIALGVGLGGRDSLFHRPTLLRLRRRPPRRCTRARRARTLARPGPAASPRPTTRFVMSQGLQP